jgi:hypothetical protein
MLEKFFLTMGELPVSKAIGASLWIYPVIQAFHLVFLAILVGSILIVDLRLLGKGMTAQPLATVARDAWPWFLFGLVGMVSTGVPQMMQNASREYYSPFFWWKMTFLATALVFTVTIRRMVARRSEGSVAPAAMKAVAFVSITLWGSVMVCGRLIGLFS